MQEPVPARLQVQRGGSYQRRPPLLRPPERLRGEKAAIYSNAILQPYIELLILCAAAGDAGSEFVSGEVRAKAGGSLG